MGKDTPQVEKFRGFMLSRVHTARVLVRTELLDPNDKPKSHPEPQNFCSFGDTLYKGE